MLTAHLAGLVRQSVEVADLTVCNDLQVVLVAGSLGTGLAVAIYDPQVKVAGLLHALLPDSSLDPARATIRPGLFLDTGLQTLLRSACQLRADPKRLRVYVAGGARLIGADPQFDLGQQNCQAMTRLLKQHGLSLTAQHVGDHVNRTLLLVLRTGEARIRISGQIREVVLCEN